MDTSLKDRILKLRGLGKSYKEISSELGCSKVLVCYHSKRHGLNDIGLSSRKIDDATIIKIQDYYKTHTLQETSQFFKVGMTTIKKYVERKRIILSDDERKTNNYLHIKKHRQKNKERAIEYKGGKCNRCGYDKCIRALHFHHVNMKDKDFNISAFSHLSWDKLVLVLELDKCELLCANCHAEEHERIDNELALNCLNSNT